MAAFDLSPQAFPMLTPQQTSPLGGVLSDAIAKRLKLAETEKQEALLPYAGKTAAAQLLGLQQQNQWNPKLWESTISSQGAQTNIAKQELLEKQLVYQKEKALRDLFGGYGLNDQRNPPPTPTIAQGVNNHLANLAATQPTTIAQGVYNALPANNPATYGPKGSQASYISPEVGDEGIVKGTAQPNVRLAPQQQLRSTAQTQEAQQQNVSQSQETQQKEFPNNPIQVINSGRTDLSYLDEQYEKNPLLRSELEKYGLKKKVEIKFDNKTGQTRVVTTYPSGKITLQTASIGQASNGIPLTNNQITKHQNVISSVDVAIPILEKIKKLDNYPLWSLPNWVGGSANEAAIYNGLVKQVLDSLIGSFGMPKTDKGLNSVQEQVEIQHLESTKAYQKRIQNLIDDLKSRKEYSATQVKKSNAIQPVGRSDVGSDSYGLENYDSGEP